MYKLNWIAKVVILDTVKGTKRLEIWTLLVFLAVVNNHCIQVLNFMYK